MKYPKHKYRMGCTVHSVAALVIGITEGRWYYWNNKVMHSSALSRMTLHTLITAVEKGIIKEAIDQYKEYNDKMQIE